MVTRVHCITIRLQLITIVTRLQCYNIRTYVCTHTCVYVRMYICIVIVCMMCIDNNLSTVTTAIGAGGLQNIYIKTFLAIKIN